MRWFGRRPRTPLPPSHEGSDDEDRLDAGTVAEVPGPSPLTVRLRDDDAAAALARDGYVRLGQLLDDDEVAAANEVFADAQRRLGVPVGDAWFPTIMLEDEAVRSAITNGLRAILGPRLEQVLVGESLEVVRLDFSVKPPSPTSGLGPHQDFALVDERVCQSLYLWVPLCDTDERNGTLHVVPGSHRFSNRIRSRHVPAVFDEVITEVEAAATRLDCRAGELIVMVSGVIHFSPPNASDQLRLAAHGIVKPAGAPLVFYYADEETPAGQVECYEVDIESYVRAIREGRPATADAPDRFEPRPPSSMTLARFEQGLASGAGR